MDAVRVLDDPAAAGSALSPIRSRIVAALREPGSATTLARELGISRQLANYHLRELERHGLVELVEERPRRGLTERVMRATARAFTVDPSILGAPAPEPGVQDAFSSAWLVTAATAAAGDVARMRKAATHKRQPLATATAQVDVSFRSPTDLRAFLDEFAQLCARYDRRGGRRMRVLTVAYPTPKERP